ncbi:hypothetical protein [Rhodococcus kronopolitis]|uniref:Uncharacterized protein n=1 Tax=Rhodococcus kronopolitis TaxID=1460226 RepID=A0ABV9FWE4_9NOCA
MPDSTTPDPTTSDARGPEAQAPDAPVPGAPVSGAPSPALAGSGSESPTTRIDRPEPAAADQPVTTVIPHTVRATPVRVGPGLPTPTRVAPAVAPGNPAPTDPAQGAPAAVAPTAVATAAVPPTPAGPAPTVRPTRIPAAEPDSTGRRRWPLWVALAAVLALVAGGAAVLFSVLRSDNTQSEVETAIHGFTDAVAGGDLATLRTATCGELGGYYQQIHDAQFAQVYKASVDQGSIPVIDSIDAVSVTDDSAIAQVTVHTGAAPSVRSERSFSLQRDGDTWKVC